MATGCPNNTSKYGTSFVEAANDSVFTLSRVLEEWRQIFHVELLSSQGTEPRKMLPVQLVQLSPRRK